MFRAPNAENAHLQLGLFDGKVVTSADESARSTSPYGDRRLLGLLPVVVGMALAYSRIFEPHPFEIRLFNSIPESEQFFFSPIANDSALIIFILTAWLAARRLPRLLETLGKTDGLILGAIGTGLAWAALAWSDYTSSPGLATASLSLFLVSGGGLVAGRAGARALLLPALFMALLAIPLSPLLVNPMIFSLQLWTAAVTTALLNLVGITAFQSGDLILTREATFHVIETCSGFRITHTLIMSAVVYAEIFHRSRRRLLTLVLAAPVIGLSVNLLRVLTLVLNPKVDVATVHTAQGIIMLIVGVLLLAAMDRLFQRMWPDPFHPLRSSDRVESSPNPLPLPSIRVGVLTVGLLVVFGLQFAIPIWQAPPPGTRLIAPFPKVVGPWRMEEDITVLDLDYLGSTGFSARTFRSYTGPDDQEINLFIGANDRSGRTMSLISPKTETLQKGFRVVERGSVEAQSGKDEMRELIARDPQGGYWMIHHGYRHVESLPFEIARRWLSLERSFLRRPEPAVVVRFATPTDPHPENREMDRVRLEAFKTMALEQIGRPLTPD